jgi:hypothetical protein
MSATARTKVERSSALDFYATPAWCVRAILAMSKFPDGSVLDPCAGDGAILKEVRTASPEGRTTRGFELDSTRAQACRDAGFECDERDALGTAHWGSPDVILMNPPYSRSMEFVARSLAEAGPKTWVIALLRLNWLAGMKRAEFHKEHPADVYVIPRRPSFTQGGTDMTEYAWFVWRRYGGGRWEILDVGGAV